MPISGTISVDAALQRAVASHRAGQVAAAVKAYQSVIATQPLHAEANHNLGVLMIQAGQVENGLARLNCALGANDAEPLYFLSYARGLLMAGRLDEAHAILDRGRVQAPGDRRFALLLDGLGSARLAQGEIGDAIRCFGQALDADPELADAHYHLGSVLSENGRVAEGFAHYMRRAALVYGTGAGPAKRDPDPPHKLRHDGAQRDYLAGGTASPGTPEVSDMFRLADGGRLDGSAVNPANADDQLLEDWRTSRPQMVVIDDFLTAPALAKLRAYCAGSTIWRKIYAAGYLGAAPEDGFACPLLAQIVEEIQSTFRAILDGERFRYLGAFKYDSELSAGTNIHADNSRLNVNFYIAPDEANLDPEHGGMEIWDLAAADVAAQRRYSSDEAAVRDLLERSDAKSTIIPHRSNRAVIFRSALFHRTDTFRFRPDYLSRRINVSLLFGQFR